jgi:hypothetical protein
VAEVQRIPCLSSVMDLGLQLAPGLRDGLQRNTDLMIGTRAKGTDLMCRDQPKSSCKKKDTFKDRNAQHCDVKQCVACSFWVREGALSPT